MPNPRRPAHQAECGPGVVRRVPSLAACESVNSGCSQGPYERTRLNLKRGIPTRMGQSNATGPISRPKGSKPTFRVLGAKTTKAASAASRVDGISLFLDVRRPIEPLAFEPATECRIRKCHHACKPAIPCWPCTIPNHECLRHERSTWVWTCGCFVPYEWYCRMGLARQSPNRDRWSTAS